MFSLDLKVDPEAAAIVFNSGLPVHMVPLEVTHTALVTADVFARLEELKVQSLLPNCQI